MVSESLVGTYLDAQGRESSIVSEEHGVLTQFAQRLQSSSSNNEPSIVDETRQEAQLLMSLMFCSSPSVSEPPECEPLSSSDHSCASDCSWTRKDHFSFTCPSLALENPSSTTSSHWTTYTEHSPRSTGLMGRALTVDDRDAVRLSADAMARNVLQSFQKAVDWRIHAWIETLAGVLSDKERALVQAGADRHEVRDHLRTTTEARLILALHDLTKTHCITALSATVEFDVHPQLVEKSDQEPAQKKQCTRRKTDTVDANYTVAHNLHMHCEVHLKTPVGFAEIQIEAPGAIEGTFGTTEGDPRAELKAVSLDVSTSILSAMMEKSSRTIVRACVELFMKNVQERSETEEAVTASFAEESAFPKVKQSPFALASPLVSTDYSFSDAAFVTPSNGASNTRSDAAQPTNNILLPIADELDDEAPRRISPQPAGLYRGVTPPRLEPRSAHLMSADRRIPLISPMAGETLFHDVPENGPSLPMLGLVEAACRAASVLDE